MGIKPSGLLKHLYYNLQQNVRLINESKLFCVAAPSDDYKHFPMLQYVYFNNTDTQKCYNISIVPDDICEINFINNISSEIFYSNLITYASRVNIEQPAANVSIDDDQEPECGR